MSAPGVAVVHLRVLRVVDGRFDAQGRMSIGIKVRTAGAGADGGGLRYHFQDGAEVELARPEPPAQGVGGILGSRLEAVHGRLEVRRSSIYLGFELLLLLLAVMVVVMMGIIYNVKLCENMRPEEEREREQCDDNKYMHST